MVAGFMLVGGGLGTRSGALLVAPAAEFCAQFGVLTLGVAHDVGLLAGALALAASFLPPAWPKAARPELERQRRQIPSASAMLRSRRRPCPPRRRARAGAPPRRRRARSGGDRRGRAPSRRRRAWRPRRGSSRGARRRRR